MIDPETISCSSELHDSCGVVFGHEGRIFRALYPRGERIFELLTKEALDGSPHPHGACQDESDA